MTDPNTDTPATPQPVQEAQNKWWADEDYTAWLEEAGEDIAANGENQELWFSDALAQGFSGGYKVGIGAGVEIYGKGNPEYAAYKVADEAWTDGMALYEKHINGPKHEDSDAMIAMLCTGFNAGYAAGLNRREERAATAR